MSNHDSNKENRRIQHSTLHDGFIAAIYRSTFLRLPYRFFSVVRSDGFREAFLKTRQRNQEQRRIKTERQQFLKERNSIVRDHKLRVSVIVPNYNHEQYLRRRLDSIYNQTYTNYEVILLDDCSTDHSATILQEYANLHPDNTRLILNKSNSGGVFRQWKKGIKSADGDICWIAESDDFADSDFLETLLYFFIDESVMLAYSHMIFYHDDGHSPFTYEQYLRPIKKQVWGREYVRSSYDEVHDALGIKNTIPNVSGVLFRRPENLSLLDDPDFLNMRVCGDWLFYLNLIVGGRVAYSPYTNSYFNLHEGSTSKSTHTQDCYYREHAVVAKAIGGLYRDSSEILEQNHQIVHDFYVSTVENATEEKFDSLYCWKEIQAASDQRKLSILMSIYAFQLGGGEIFPIRLANALKRMGYPVTLHCISDAPRMQKVVDMLDKDIPIVHASTEEAFIKLLTDFHFDIIHTHYQANQQMIGELKRRRPEVLDRCRHIATLHGMYEALPAQYVIDCLPVIDQAVDVWVRVAEKNLLPFKTAGIPLGRKHVSVSNGVEIPTSYSITRESLDIPENAFILCLASRAIPQKGWLEAIDSVRLAREQSGRDIHLLLLGTGVIYDQLVQVDVPAYIHLLGLVASSCAYYHISDMGILPSCFSGESMPLSIMEALATGRPVIASRIGEVAQLLGDGTEMAGKVFDLEEGKIPISYLAEIIENFATDSACYRKAAQAAAKKSAEYDIRHVAERYLEIYKNSISGSGQNG